MDHKVRIINNEDKFQRPTFFILFAINAFLVLLSLWLIKERVEPYLKIKHTCILAKRNSMPLRIGKT